MEFRKAKTHFAVRPSKATRRLSIVSATNDENMRYAPISALWVCILLPDLGIKGGEPIGEPEEPFPGWGIGVW